jgi:hypothetical protein
MCTCVSARVALVPLCASSVLSGVYMSPSPLFIYHCKVKKSKGFRTALLLGKQKWSRIIREYSQS